MKDIIEKHGYDLAQILEDAEDLSEDVAEARDALVEELVGDPHLQEVIEVFRSLAENHRDFEGFHYKNEEAFLTYKIGCDPNEVSLQDIPYTAVRVGLNYNENGIAVQVKEQDVVRLEEWIEGTPYEIFVECFFTRSVKSFDIETFLNAEDKERKVESMADSVRVDLKERDRGYLVAHVEEGEVLKSGLTKREAFDLTKEDFDYEEEEI